jgi:hypothetical protein
MFIARPEFTYGMLIYSLCVIIIVYVVDYV